MRLPAYAIFHLSDIVGFPLPSFCFIQPRYMLICLLLRFLGERSSSKSLLPLLLAVAGVLLIARPGEVLISIDTGPDFQKGLIFGLLSGLSFGATIIMIRYLRHDYTGIAQTFWLTGISLLFMLPSALSTPFLFSLKTLTLLILFGFTITFAAVIYLKGISGIRAQTGSILALVEPVSGIFFDITVLKNPLYISTLLGCSFHSHSSLYCKQQGIEVKARNVTPIRKRGDSALKTEVSAGYVSFCPKAIYLRALYFYYNGFENAGKA